MKKFISVIILFIVVFLCAFFLGRVSTKFKKINDENKNSNLIDNSELNTISHTNTLNTQIYNSNIIEKGELKTSGLWTLDGHSSYYEIDLMQNDMTWNNNCGLYHKIIKNIEDYNKYSNRINLPQMSEKDFEKRFLIIIANENLRNNDEKDLTIHNVFSDGKSTHIIMKQKKTLTLVKIKNF